MEFIRKMIFVVPASSSLYIQIYLRLVKNGIANLQLIEAYSNYVPSCALFFHVSMCLPNVISRELGQSEEQNCYRKN